VATAPAPPEGEREARGSEVDPQVLELRELVEEQRLALAALQEQAAAPRTTTERPPVVAPVPVAAGSSDRDDERIDALRAELDERTKALADAQWKMQYHLDQQATAPQVVAPAPGATAQEMEIARLQAELAAARQAPVASPTPAAVLGVPQESDLRAEIEALRQQLEEGQQGSASETAKVREMVLATEEDRLRMEELAGRLDQLSADKAQLAAQLADADTERAAQLEAERQAAEARSSAMQAELARLQTRTKEMEERYMGRYESLLAQLQPLIDSGLNVRVVAGKIRVDLPSDVLFGSGSATLSRNGRAEVQAVAKALTPFRNLLVQVEGHTDSVPVKSFKYESNYDLAYARAKEVMSVLLEGGLPPERVSAASFGDTRPVASNGTREGRAENRRIELDLELMPVE
jgi:chemotaxis protein MotB